MHRPLRASAVIGLSIGLGVLLASPACDAQVLAVDSDGAVTVFNGPAVYTDAGVAPIVAPRATKSRAVVSRRIARSGAGKLVTRASLDRAATAAALSPALVGAIAWRESGMRAGAVSRAGALGAMQLMPATARSLGVDASDPDQNLKGGASYFAALMRRYDGDLVRALSAYNAGPAAVARYGGLPPYKETQAYVAAVLDRMSQAVVPLSRPVK